MVLIHSISAWGTVMALFYESKATLWISIELIRERYADPWLIVNDVLHCK